MGKARTLVAAVSWLSLGNMLSRLVALFTMPLLTRWLSPDAYGDAALAGTVVALLSVVALAGIDMGYARHFFSGTLGDSQAVESFCWRWTAGMTLIAGLGGGLLWVLGLSTWFDTQQSLFVFIMLGIVASPLATMAQTRARLQGNYARTSRAQFVAGWGAAAVALGVAYWWRQDAWPLLLAMIAGYVVPLILLGLPSTASLTRPSGLSPTARRQLVGVGLAGVVTAPAYWVVSSSDRWFLARYFDSAEVGVYSIAYTVGTVGMVVSTAITAAWLPELSRAEAASSGDFARRRGELGQLLVAAMLVVWLAVVASGGDVIRLLADVRFHGATSAVPWLAAGVLFYGVMHVGNTQLILLGKLHWAAWIWVVALVMSIGVNFWLVPTHGMLGAAITQGGTFLLTMVLTWAALLHLERVPVQWTRLGLAVGVAAIACLATHPQWGRYPLSSLAYKLPLELAIAALCFQLLAPGFLRRAVDQVRR